MAALPTTTPMPADSTTREAEVRDLVRRVLSGVLDGGAGPTTDAPHDGDSPTTETEPRSADTRRVAIGADHGGFQLKEKLVVKLGVAGYEVHDCGTNSAESVDYPDFAHAVARAVADGTCDWGVIVDGAGIGSAMVANKVPGIRAALCYDLSSARNSREHNHANVLTLGAGLVGPALAWQIVEEWLSVPWGGDRHARRVGLITDIEHQYVAGAS